MLHNKEREGMREREREGGRKRENESEYVLEK
jgi:hypothetical protein